MRKQIVLVLSLSVVHAFAVAEKSNFVVAKKTSVDKKRPSPSKLKTEIGDSYGRLLKKQASIIERMAQTNKELVDRTHELLDDECNVTLNQLQQHKNDLVAFEKKLDTFESDACYMLSCLHDGLQKTA